MQLTITLPTDPDGMLGRLCPKESCRPRYFKIIVSSAPPQASADEGKREDASVGETQTDPRLWCPYCAHQDASQSFTTLEQLEYAKSVAFREFTSLLQQQLKKLERRPDPGAFLSIGIEVKLGELPAIAEYMEQHLKRTMTCPHCERQYAIYGISFICPHCGQATLLWHLDSDAEIISATIQLAERSELDTARQRIIENALEDVVSLWEGYLKILYAYSLKHTKTTEESERLLHKLKTTFQRIDSAESRFQQDLGISLLTPLSPEQTTQLHEVFQKRHLFTHNLGIADESYQAHTGSGRIGQEIDVIADEVRDALATVQIVLRSAYRQVFTS